MALGMAAPAASNIGSGTTSAASTPTYGPKPIQTVELQIESPDDAIDGKGVITKHEGAAIDYFFVNTSNDTSKLHFDPDTHTLFQPVNEHVSYRFNIENNFTMFSTTGNQPVTLDHYYLNYNNSPKGFAACKDINDPYQISEKMPAIMYLGEAETPHNCSPLTLKVAGIYMVL